MPLLAEHVSVVHEPRSTLFTNSVVVENPAKKWPGAFSQVPLFVEYPYLLPTIVASVVTFAGEPIRTPSL